MFSPKKVLSSHLIPTYPSILSSFVHSLTHQHLMSIAMCHMLSILVSSTPKVQNLALICFSSYGSSSLLFFTVKLLKTVVPINFLNLLISHSYCLTKTSLTKDLSCLHINKSQWTAPFIDLTSQEHFTLFTPHSWCHGFLFYI